MQRKDLIKSANEKIAELNIEELKKAGLIPLGGEYFPHILYPPITMCEDMTEEDLFPDYPDCENSPLSVYAHIPFCTSHCNFCHFVIKTGASLEEKDCYLDAMEKEMQLFKQKLGLEKIPARTINVGGGTATCLSPKQLERFLKFFTGNLDLTTCKQITYDVSPETLLGKEGLERLAILKSYNVDRITIGAQSFNDTILKRMNRAHNAQDILTAVKQTKEAGINSICIDLIYGYPGQTIDSWIKDLETTVSLGIESYQLYRLRITPYGFMPGQIFNWAKDNPNQFLWPEQTLIMKALGFLISSQHGYSDKNYTRLFSKDYKDISIYNEDQCCKGLEAIGIGVSAFCNLSERFAIKETDFNQYCSLINQGKIPIKKGKIRTKDDLLRKNLTGPLKNMQAVYKKFYQKKMGVSLNEIFSEKISALKKYGLLSEDEEKIVLTERGHFFADEVCIQFYNPKYIPFPKSSYANGKLNPYNDGGNL